MNLSKLHFQINVCWMTRRLTRFLINIIGKMLLVEMANRDANGDNYEIICAKTLIFVNIYT